MLFMSNNEMSYTTGPSKHSNDVNESIVMYSGVLFRGRFSCTDIYIRTCHQVPLCVEKSKLFKNGSLWSYQTINSEFFHFIFRITKQFKDPKQWTISQWTLYPANVIYVIPNCDELLNDGLIFLEWCIDGSQEVSKQKSGKTERNERNSSAIIFRSIAVNDPFHWIINSIPPLLINGL